jgi:hypothetical protein
VKIEHGLPEGFLVAPEPPKRQRKQNSSAVVTDHSQMGVALTPPQDNDSATAVAVESANKKRGRPKKTLASAAADAAIVDAVPKKRGRPPKDGNGASAKPQPKKRKALAGGESPSKSSPPVFRLPREFSFASSADSTQIHEDPTISAPRLTESTHPAIDPPSQLSSFSTTPQVPSNPVPGETTSPAMLRALRASRWGLTGPNASTTAATAADTPYAVAPKVPPGALVVDLTD